MLQDRSAARSLGCVHQRLGLLVVESILIGVGQSFFQCHRRDFWVGHGVRKIKLLSRRQSDGARQRELLFGEFVLDCDQSLLACLKVHLRTQHVDAGSDSAVLKVKRLLVDRF